MFSTKKYKYFDVLTFLQMRKVLTHKKYGY